MKDEKDDQQTEKNIDDDQAINSADYYRKNPNINKKNAVTIIMPSRDKFIEVQTMVEEGKKIDPSLTVGRLFLKALDSLYDLPESKINEIKEIVAEIRKQDPNYKKANLFIDAVSYSVSQNAFTIELNMSVGKLFLQALAYCQSQGFYIVNTEK